MNDIIACPMVTVENGGFRIASLVADSVEITEIGPEIAVLVDGDVLMRYGRPDIVDAAASRLRRAFAPAGLADRITVTKFACDLPRAEDCVALLNQAISSANPRHVRAVALGDLDAAVGLRRHMAALG